MQFQNLVALFASVSAVQAATQKHHSANSTVVAGNTTSNSTGSNGTMAVNSSNSTKSSKVSKGAANSNTLNAGMFGAFVAAGVAFLF